MRPSILSTVNVYKVQMIHHTLPPLLLLLASVSINRTNQLQRGSLVKNGYLDLLQWNHNAVVVHQGENKELGLAVRAVSLAL